MDITDKYIDDLFDGTSFGDKIDTTSQGKRDQLFKTLKDQVGGYWSGHTAYHIAVNGGFLIDSNRQGEKKLTALGRLFMDSHQSVN